MPNTSQSSFIPKNNVPNRKKVGRRYNFFFVSLVVYGLFIATPIASAVVFIYEKHTNNVINQTTRNLDIAIKSFNESDLLTVTRLDNRLIASSEVLAASVPLNSLLQFFLQNAPKTVSFTEIEVFSVDNGMVKVSAEVTSESFDYVLFYREELLRNPAFVDSSISEVVYRGSSSDQASGGANSESAANQNSKLRYQIDFTVPVSFFFTNFQTESNPAVFDAEPEVVEEVMEDVVETEPVSDNLNDS